MQNDSTLDEGSSEWRVETMFKHWRTALTLGYTLAALCWTLPAGYFPFKATLDPIVSKPLIFFNIWQAWGMFGPEPLWDDIWVQVTVTDAAGQKHARAASRMIELSYLERYQKERWRKFFNEHLRMDANSHLWQPYVDYVRREEVRRGVIPETIELTRWWRPAIVPVAPGLRERSPDATSG